MNRLLTGRFKLSRPQLRVPDVILKSVGFIVSYVGPDTFDVEGTGFFVGVPSKIRPAVNYNYFVTAWHLALGLLDRDVGILVNRKDGGVDQLQTTGTWFNHPTDPSVDVAVTPCEPSDDLDIAPIEAGMLLTPDSIKDQSIGIGDEVFLPGLFEFASGLGTGGPEGDHVMPIIRHGNIAMLPKQKIFLDIGPNRHAAEVYLIEARSIGGISGSPIFARKTVRIPIEQKQTGHQSHIHGLGDFFLLGLMHGHWDIKESERNKYRVPIDGEHGVNLGIAMVAPAHKILEVINRPDLVAGRTEMDRILGDAITPHPDRV